MAVNILGEVLDTQLGSGPQAAFSAIPQTSDPATTANSQIYAKTDKNLYHKDSAGLVTNLLAGAQSAANALGGRTTEWPYGAFNFTGPGLINSGASQNIFKGYIAKAAGSVVAASWMGAAGAAVNGSVQVYKNNALFFTALTGTNFAASGTSGPVSAVFPAGTYPYVKNDYFDVYYTGSGSGLYMGVGIAFAEGNAYANSLSTGITANATIAATDNQRVWVANASTAYTLTLPPTQATQDFYVRVVMSAGAGVVIQAPSGVSIYLGTTVSATGGNITTSAVGSNVVLLNPAGTNIWVAVAVTGNWNVT